MKLKKLIAIQSKFDEEHGWPTGGETVEEFIANINSDLVGFVGELGEFSNIIKKFDWMR